MHTETLSDWVHDHVFHTSNEAAERSTRLVMWITAITMVVEITAGWWFNSMALLADGWHMSSHAVAIGLSAFAYATARRYAQDPRFAFGTWKIEILGGFASAIFLVVVAVMMSVGSVERIISPQPIQYKEAIVIAILGLVVNVVCALILGKAHHHDHGHSHGHDHGHSHSEHHHDLNLKSAYIHVIADAATSVLAIAALVGGWIFGWAWLDPFMGIVGAVLVAVWAKGLIADTGKVLLDREMDHPVVDEIREVVETGAHEADTRITDLHVWRVGKQVYSCAMPTFKDIEMTAHITSPQSTPPFKRGEPLQRELISKAIEAIAYNASQTLDGKHRDKMPLEHALDVLTSEKGQSILERLRKLLPFKTEG